MSEGENQAKNEQVTEVASANNSLESASSATKLAGDTFSSPAFKPDTVVQTNADNLLLARASFEVPQNNPVVKPETVKPQSNQPDSTVNSFSLPLSNTRNLRFDPRTLDPRQAPGFYGNVQNSESDIFPFFAQERVRPELRLENLNKQVSDRPEIQEILNASKFYNGAILWHGTKYERSVSEGRFASAAAVSRVLQDVGYNYADSSKPANLLNKLIANGWEVVGQSQAKPGDVVIGGKTNTQWREGNDNAVAGIIGPNGTVYSTGGDGGRWTQGTMDQLFPADQYKDQIWVLRPPKGMPPVNDFNPQAMDNPNAMMPNQQYEMPQMPGRISFDQFSQTFRQNVQRDFNAPNTLPGYNPNGRFEVQPNQYRFDPQQMPQQWVNPRQPSDAPNERPPLPPPGVNVYEFYDAYYKNKWEQYYKAKYERGDFNRPGNDRTQGPEIIDGPRSQQRSAQLYDLARRAVGRPVWQTSEWADKTENGRLASASSVGEVLKAAGYEYAHAPGVADLTKTLIRHGWQPTALQNLRPGDVIYGATQDGWENKSGPAASMGIVGENGFVYMCDRRTGNWSRMRMEEAFPPEQYGRRLWAVRAPERDVQPSVPDPRRRNEYPADMPNSPTYRPEAPAYNSAEVDAIANIAMQSNGRRMWTDTGANLGCAQSVAGMLRAANVRIDNLRRVGDVFDALQRNQWRAIQTDKNLTGLKPGDVIVCGRAPGMQWKGVDGGAHMGIVGADGKIYSNNSRTGVVIGVDAERFTRDPRYQSFYILRSPGSDQPGRPVPRPGASDQALDGPDGPLTPVQRRIAEMAGGSVVGGRGGWCARAVKADLDRAGLNIRRIVGSANAWDMGQKMMRSGEWVQIPSQNARPGDVLVLHDPNYVGDIRIVKSRSGDTIQTVNDLRYGNESVNLFGDKRYKKYDKGIFLRYVGDSQNAPQQTVQPPRYEEPRYNPQPEPRPMPYQRPYQQIPNMMSLLPPQIADRIPPQLMNQIPHLMNRFAPGMMRNMPPEMMNFFGAQPYYPQQYRGYQPYDYQQNPYADPYANQYGDQSFDPQAPENEFQQQEQEEEREVPTRQNDSQPDYWSYYNQRRRGYEQYQDQYNRQQQEADRRRADNDRQQQQQQADAERQREAERNRQNAERQRQQEADRERQRMEAERNRRR